MKEVLQMAADADARKDSLVEEVRASAREAKLANDREREALARERGEFELERRLTKDENMAVRGKMQETEYSQKETNNKLEMTQRHLADKIMQNDVLARESEALKRQLTGLQQEFDILQQTSKDVESLLRKELDDLRGDIEEL